MIVANCFRLDGRLSGFSVRGHAGFAPAGHDIVCSAVSAVVHMAALGLTQVLSLPADVQQTDGFVAVSLPESALAQAEPFLRALEAELLEIAKQYPKHLRVTYQERREFKCFS